MEFELSDHHRLLRDTVRDFAAQEIAPVAEELDRSKSFPYEIVKRLGELDLMGIPYPRGVRRWRRRLAGLCACRRGARARRLLGGDHAVRPHLAGDAAAVPVRLRRAEAAVAAAAVLRRAARRVRADRARGRLGCRQHPDARAARRRRLGDRRLQAIHHQRGHGHHRAGRDHRRHRPRQRDEGDLEHPGRERHARLRTGRALPEDGLERLGHPTAVVRRLPRARPRTWSAPAARACASS